MRIKEGNQDFLRDARFSYFLLSFAKGLSVGLFLTLLVSTLMSYVVPYAMKLAIDSLLVNRSSGPKPRLLMLYLTAALLSVVLSKGERYVSARQDEVIQHRFRDEIVSRILRKDVATFGGYQYGQLQTVLTNAISTIVNSVYCIIETSIIVPLGLLAGMLYITMLSLSLVPFIVAEICVMYCVISRGTKRRSEAYRNQLIRQTKYFGVLEAIHKAYENIRLSFRVAPARQSHLRESEKFAQANVQYRKTQIQIDTAIGLAHGVLNIVALYVFYLLIRLDRASPGDYFAYIAMKEVIVGSMNGFIQLKLRAKELHIAAEEVNALVPIEDLMRSEPSLSEETDSAAIGEIRFDNVVFSYPAAKTAYRFNYRFRAGRKYLIMGDNGIGKTTLVRIIAGLCPLNKGRILVNGTVDIGSMDEALKRSKIAILPQDITIFEKALAGIFPGINSEPTPVLQGPTRINGDTDVESLVAVWEAGDVGSRRGLSGGQKKRMLLAAMFRSDPDVIILDEPYAELDAGSSETLTRYINEFSTSKIIIVITHYAPAGLDLHNCETVHMRRNGSDVLLQSQ